MSREGNLEAPTRHPIDWKNPDFYNEEKCEAELERIFDICHGCRRCVSLCNAFPTLFDLVDESPTLEVDGVDKKDFIKAALTDKLGRKASDVISGSNQEYWRFAF